MLDPPRTHVLLVRKHPEQRTAHVLPVSVSGDPEVMGGEIVFDGVPSYGSTFAHPSGHDGGTRWATASATAAGFVVHVRDLESTAPVAVAVPLAPAAVHFAAEHLLVGADNLLGAIDLAAPTPAWRTLVARPDELYKAYDVFARSGTWVIAIDDTVEPKYADSLKLDERGQPTHVRGWEMPEIINGVYQHAVLRPSSEGEGTLYILASYGISSGNGHILAALRVRDHAITSPANSSLNDGSRYGTIPVLAEHVPRTGVEPPKLISGSAYTSWTGLALHSETLLISARGRGLLVLRSTFGRNTRPEAVDVGGDCLDVLADDDRIWVLVGGSTTSLAEYTWEGDTLRELARTVLPSEYDEIVD